MSEREAATLADEIFGFLDCNPEPVIIPEWGGRTVYIREISAKASQELNAKLKALSEDQVVEGLCLTVIACVSDELGRPIFNESHMEQLMGRNVNVLQRLQELGAKKMRFDQPRADLKNGSGETKTDDSPSVSPEKSAVLT